MKITWYGHACFGVESADYRIVLDPYQQVRGYAPLQLTADAVLCSHEHFDHNARAAVTLRSGAPSPFTVETMDTFHDARRGALRGENTVHILRAEGLTVVHLGDLGHPLSRQQAERLRGCDVLMIPVGGFYTIDAETARDVAEQIAPRVAVPMHYRSGPRGFEEIAPLEAFTDLFPAEQVHLLDASGFDPLAWQGVVVPRCRA